MRDLWPFDKVWKKGAPVYHVLAWGEKTALCFRGHYQWHSGLWHEEHDQAPEPRRMCRDCAKPLLLITEGLERDTHDD